MITPEIGRLIDELRSSLGNLETALDAIPHAIVYTDVRGKMQWCNRAFERLAGRRRIDLFGLPIAKFPLPAKASRTPMKVAKKRVGFVFVVAPEDARD